MVMMVGGRLLRTVDEIRLVDFHGDGHHKDGTQPASQHVNGIVGADVDGGKTQQDVEWQ